MRTPVSVYQQKSGLSMGSSLSPALSNIFVNDLETKIVKKYIKNKKILSYSRFADDSLLIIHKNAIRNFLKEINNWDKSLKFTVEYMNSENSINFLDINIFLNKDKKSNLKNTEKIH